MKLERQHKGIAEVKRKTLLEDNNEENRCNGHFFLIILGTFLALT
jgi:hypothetical protein